MALGHGVVATDPDPAMLDRLRRNLPDVGTLETHAEELPVGDHGFDVVVAAQAFHWFDLDRALPEIARALKRGGALGLVWNWRDDRIPWVRRLGALIGTQEQLADPTEAIAASGLFGEVEEATFTHWQQVDRHSIQDLVLSRSNVAVLDEEARAAKLAEVLALYDEYGRGMDGMQLPYVTKCYRADGGRPPRRRGGGRGVRRVRRVRRRSLGRHRHRHAPHRLPLSSRRLPTIRLRSRLGFPADGRRRTGIEAE